MLVVVSDTSPLRALAHVGQLQLLKTLFGEVLIPPAVVHELEQPLSRLPPISIAQFDYIRIQSPQDRNKVQELQEILGPGEAEALALALEVRADIVLVDETAGRSMARKLGLSPLGVLGILLRAKQRNHLKLLRPLLDSLQIDLGFYISPSLREEILQKAKE